MKRPPLGLLLLQVLIGVGLVVTGAWRLASRPARPAADAPLELQGREVLYPQPKLELTDLAGRRVALAPLRGRVLLINLWASWCPPCVEELPILQRFFEQHAADGLVIVGINDGESAEVVAAFADANNLSFPIWLDADFKAERAFGTISLPSSYLIDRRGMIRHVWIGRITRGQLEASVLPLLQED